MGNFVIWKGENHPVTFPVGKCHPSGGGEFSVLFFCGDREIDVGAHFWIKLNNTLFAFYLLKFQKAKIRKPEIPSLKLKFAIIFPFFRSHQ